MELSSPDRFSCSAASYCGPTRLAIWSRSIATPLARFGSLNYVADIRGDLIFNGFETAAIAPPRSDEHDLNLSSDQILEMVPVTATTLDPEQFAPSEATEPAALEPHTDSAPGNMSVNGIPDSFPAINSEPHMPADTELDRSSIFEFSAADVFQHSPLGDVLNSLKKTVLGRGLTAEPCPVRARG